MDQQTELATNDVRGRKDGEGQPAVINLEVLTTRVPDLCHLKSIADAASDAYGEAVKKTAEQSGLLAAVVRRFVNARYGEKYEQEKTKAEQLVLCFAEIGEDKAS